MGMCVSFRLTLESRVEKSGTDANNDISNESDRED